MAGPFLVSHISPKNTRALPSNLNPRNLPAAWSLCPFQLGLFPDSTAWWGKGSSAFPHHHFHNILGTVGTLHEAKAAQELLTLSSLQPCWKQLWNMTQLLPKIASLCLQHRKHQPLQPPPLSPLERAFSTPHWQRMPQNPKTQDLIPSSPSKLAAVCYQWQYFVDRKRNSFRRKMFSSSLIPHPLPPQTMGNALISCMWVMLSSTWLSHTDTGRTQGSLLLFPLPSVTKFWTRVVAQVKHLLPHLYLHHPSTKTCCRHSPELSQGQPVRI